MNPARVRQCHERLAQIERPVVALSGGVDSTVLLALAASANPATRAIHVNHHLRPDSDRDADCARASCANLGVPCSILSVDPDAIVEHPGGTESGARAVRYAALAAATRDDETLLTAHTADDHLETIALHLHHGTGVAGLIGPRDTIVIASRTVVRPLLEWFRDEVVAFAIERDLRWIDDPSNTDPRFVRNRMRRDVVPVLRESIAREPLRRSLRRIAADADRLERLDRAHLDAARHATQPGRIELDVATLCALHCDDRAAALRVACLEVGAARVSEARLFEAAAWLAERPNDWKLDGEGARFERVGNRLCLWRRHGRAD